MASKEYLNYEGLQEFYAKLKQKYGVALQFKGTVQDVAALPSLGSGTTVKQGFVYNIVDEDETTADFVEGAGHVLRAGSNVAAVNVAAGGAPEVLKWDILAGFFSVDDKLTFGDTMPATPADGDTFLYMGDTTHTFSAVTGLVGTENPHALGYYEVDATAPEGYAVTTDTLPEHTYAAFSDGTDTYFTESATPQVGDAVYTISGGTKTDTGETVDTVSGDIITVTNITTAGDLTRTAASDAYIDEKTYYTAAEQYITGVIYVYDQSTTSWVAQTAGDTYVPITNAEIDALFD